MQTFYMPFANEEMYDIELLPEDASDIEKHFEMRQEAINTKTSLLTNDTRRFSELNDEEKKVVLSDKLDNLSAISMEVDMQSVAIVNRVLSETKGHCKATENIGAVVVAKKNNLLLLKHYNKLLKDSHTTDFIKELSSIALMVYMSVGNKQIDSVDLSVLPDMTIVREYYPINTNAPIVASVDMASGIACLPKLHEHIVFLNELIISELEQKEEFDWDILTLNDLTCPELKSRVKFALDVNKAFFKQLEKMYRDAIANATENKDVELEKLINRITELYSVICRYAEAEYCYDKLKATESMFNDFLANEAFESTISKIFRNVINIIVNIVQKVIVVLLNFISQFQMVAMEIYQFILSLNIENRIKEKLTYLKNTDVTIFISENDVEGFRYAGIQSQEKKFKKLYQVSTGLKPKITEVNNINGFSYTYLPISSGNYEKVIKEMAISTVLSRGLILNLVDVESLLVNEYGALNSLYNDVGNYLDSPNSQASSLIKYIDTNLATCKYILDKALTPNEVKSYGRIISEMPLKRNYGDVDNITENLTDYCRDIREWSKKINTTEQVTYNHRSLKVFSIGVDLSNRNSVIQTKLYNLGTDRKWNNLTKKIQQYSDEAEKSGDENARKKSIIVSEIIKTANQLIRVRCAVVANSYKLAAYKDKLDSCYMVMCNSLLSKAVKLIKE